MATHPPVAGRVRYEGVALTLYVVLLPYVIATKWPTTYLIAHGDWVRLVLVALAVCWSLLVGHLFVQVRRVGRGGAITGGTAWIASLLIVALPFLSSSVAEAAPVAAPLHVVAHHNSLSPVLLSPVPVALAAKRTRDALRRDDPPEDDINELVELLRHGNRDVLATLAAMVGEHDDVVVDVTDFVHDEIRFPIEPSVACALGPSHAGYFVAVARIGGTLSVGRGASAAWEEHVTALHEGPLVIARHEAALLRALALRDAHTLVLYVGDEPLTEELAARCVRVRPYGEDPAPHRYDTPRVELLRAQPRVTGLHEPFLSTIQRRCVEMTAYLALHHHEPITGERLRSRVLGSDELDASTRTLANTATAIRRSLGLGPQGPRLHPVTQAGLYELSDVTCDLVEFNELIALARVADRVECSRACRRALALVGGEPLATALRGYEWFLAEGHAARLARDGEWAALSLSRFSLEENDVETAYWALSQGVLLDPYSDIVRAELARVPRLREFGRDARGRAQHDTVSPSRAVAVTWSFASLTHQVTQ